MIGSKSVDYFMDSLTGKGVEENPLMMRLIKIPLPSAAAERTPKITHRLFSVSQHFKNMINMRQWCYDYLNLPVSQTEHVQSKRCYPPSKNKSALSEYASAKTIMCDSAGKKKPTKQNKAVQFGDIRMD